MKKNTIVVVSVVIMFLFVATAASAQSLVPSNCQGNNCQLIDLITVLVNVADIVLKVSGSFALLMFVYGGFVWVTAAGNSSRVEQGKNILVGTVVAIIIILGAFTGVQFIGQTLGVGGDFNRFLSSGGSGSVCKNAGDACVYGSTGQNVYACSAVGTCTSVPLCTYWSTKTPNPYSLTSAYKCVDTNANPGASGCVSNLCSGPAHVRCCVP